MLLAIFMIVFIVFSGLWERSSFGSMLGYTYGVYSKTDDWAGVDMQYDQMISQFNSGAYRYTYEIANLSVAVDKNMVGDHQDKDTYINTVLTVYTEDLYHLNTLTGIRGGIHYVASDMMHEIYGVVSVIIGAIVLWIMRAAYMRGKGSVDFLKHIGAGIFIAALVSFIAMMVIYSFFVEPWIGTQEDIYMQGLPIIAAMIKEFYTYYIIALGIIGFVFMLPAIPSMLKPAGEKEAAIKVENK